MNDVINLIPSDTNILDREEFNNQITKKKDLLSKQLKLLHGDNYNAEEVFLLNKKMRLNDD